MRPKILIVYHQYAFPLRSTVRDLLYAYRKYADAECVYLNTAGRRTLPEVYTEQSWDLIIFHTVFISLRWGGDAEYENVRKLLAPLQTHPAKKIVMPQDEWIHTNILTRFIKDFHINAVFSVAPPSEWGKIYAGVDRSRVSFHYVLTGYIEQAVVDLVASKGHSSRTVDIGYRAYKAPPWLGRHGFLKTDIADVFNRRAPAQGFSTDISTDERDTIVGDGWYDFLLRCKYFIGLEGGSTVIDPDGSIWAKGTAYMQEHPGAGFEEVEAAVFPGMDGNLNLIAISPRHLECCITRTAQVLMEGDYNGILKAGEHYIELKKDYSNLDEVFRLMQDESLRQTLTENAYRDIVDSRRYHYESFVAYVLNDAIGYQPATPTAFETSLSRKMARAEERYNRNLTLKARIFRQLMPLRGLYRKSGLKTVFKLIKK